MQDHIVFLSRQQAGLIRAMLQAFQENRDPQKYRATLAHVIAELDERMSPELAAELFIGVKWEEPR